MPHMGAISELLQIAATEWVIRLEESRVDVWPSGDVAGLTRIAALRAQGWQYAPHGHDLLAGANRRR